MTTMNPFDILGDTDNDDLSQLVITAQQQQLKAAPKKTLAASLATGTQKQLPSQGRMPMKSIPPHQAEREAKNEMAATRGRGRTVMQGGGRGGRVNRDYGSRENIYNSGTSGGYGGVEEGESGKSLEKVQGAYAGPRGPYRGGRDGGFSNGEVGESDRPSRQFDRQSGTGSGNELKRKGSGRGNWGNPTDENVHEPAEVIHPNERISSPEVQPGEEDAAVANEENPMNEPPRSSSLKRSQSASMSS